MSRLQRDSSVSRPFCQAVGPGSSSSGLTGLATAVGSVALGSAGFVLPTAALQAGMNTEQTNGVQTLQQDSTTARRRHSLRTSFNNASVLTSTSNGSVRTSTNNGSVRTSTNNGSLPTSTSVLATQQTAQIPQAIRDKLDMTLEAALSRCEEGVTFQQTCNADAILRESFRKAVTLAVEYRALATAVKSLFEQEKALSFPPDEIRILMSWLGKERTIEYLQSRIEAHSPDAKPAPATNAGRTPVLQLEGKPLEDIYETLKEDIPMLKCAVALLPKWRRGFVDNCVRQWESQVHHMVWPDVSTPTIVSFRDLADFYCSTACGLLQQLGAVSTPKKFYSNYEQLKDELPAVVDKMFGAAIDALTRARTLREGLSEGTRSSLYTLTYNLKRYRKLAPELLKAYFKEEDAKSGKVEDFVEATLLKVLERQTQNGKKQTRKVKKFRRPVFDVTRSPTTFVDMCMLVDDIFAEISNLCPSSVEGLKKSRRHLLPVQSQMTVPVSTETIEKIRALPEITDTIIVHNLSVAYVKQPKQQNTETPTAQASLSDSDGDDHKWPQAPYSTVTQTLGGSKH